MRIEKDIKNLSTIYGQIDNFKNCTQQTDQSLAKLIYDTFPEYVTPKAGGMNKKMTYGLIKKICIIMIN